jgi:hypothetical protein
MATTLVERIRERWIWQRQTKGSNSTTELFRPALGYDNETMHSLPSLSLGNGFVRIQDAPGGNTEPRLPERAAH